MLAYKGKLAWEFLNQESLWAKYAKSRFQIWKDGSPLWNSLNHLVETSDKILNGSCEKGIYILRRYVGI